VLKQKNAMSKGKAIGTLAGTLGSIAGIIFAHEKASKNGKQIVDKDDAYTDSLCLKLDEFSNSRTESVESSHEKANKFKKT
jgi:hypothetical protein